MTSDAAPARRPPDAAAALNLLTRPRSIAVVGASPDESKLAGRVVPNLHHYGYGGTVLAVNPRHSRVAGVDCVPDIASLPTVPDTALVLVPAAAVLGVLEQLEAHGVPTATVVASGFEESIRHGRARLEALNTFLSTARIRVLGPNSIGPLDTESGAVQRATTNLPSQLQPGSVAIATQSGAMSLILLHQVLRDHLGLSQVIPLGNESDLDLADAIHHLSRHPQTDVVITFIESIGNADRLADAAVEALDMGVTLIAIVAGASELGQAVAAGHTGALATDPRLSRALLRDLGITVVAGPRQAVDAVHLAAPDRATAVRGTGLAVACLSGGEAALLADQAEANGVELPQPSGLTKQTLDEAFRFSAARNPMDLTADALTEPDLFRTAYEAFRRDERNGRIAFVLPPLTGGDRERIDAVLDNLRASDPQVCVVRWPALGAPRGGDLEDSSHLMSAHAALVRAEEYGRPRKLTDRVRGDAVTSGVAWLPDDEVRDRARRAGLTWVAERHLRVEDDVPAACDALRAPWVLKAWVDGVPHKSDWGGVVTGLTSRAEVREVLSTLRSTSEEHWPGRWLGAWLQSTCDGFEAYVGAIRDPRLGPFVAAGRGGTAVEHDPSVQFAPLPANGEHVRRLIAVSDLNQLERPLRGAPAVPLRVLVQQVEAVAKLLAAPNVVSVDANPIFVSRTRQQATVVDLRVGVGEGSP